MIPALVNLSTGITFTITAADDPLTVISTLPAEGAVEVEPDPTLRLSFDVPLSPLTLERSYFELSDAAGGAVGVRVVLSADDDRVVEVSPFGELAPATEYTLTVSIALRDIQGRHLAVPFQLTFVTL